MTTELAKALFSFVDRRQFKGTAARAMEEAKEGVDATAEIISLAQQLGLLALPCVVAAVLTRPAKAIRSPCNNADAPPLIDTGFENTHGKRRIKMSISKESVKENVHV